MRTGLLTDSVETALLRHIVFGEAWTQITAVRIVFLASIPTTLESGVIEQPVFTSEPVAFISAGPRSRVLDSTVQVTVSPLQRATLSAVALQGDTGAGAVPIIYNAIEPIDVRTLDGFTLVPEDIAVTVDDTVSETLAAGIFSVLFDSAASITSFTLGNIHVGLSVGIPSADLSTVHLMAPFTTAVHFTGGVGRNKSAIDFGTLTTAPSERAFTHAAFLDGSDPATAKLLKHAPLQQPIMSHAGLHVVAAPGSVVFGFV